MYVTVIFTLIFQDGDSIDREKVLQRMQEFADTTKIYTIFQASPKEEIQKLSDIERLIEDQRNCLNPDLAFKHSREILKDQLNLVDEVLYKQRKQLYFKRNFELHSLSEA